MSKKHNKTIQLIEEHELTKPEKLKKIDTENLNNILNEIHDFYLKHNPLESLQNGISIYPDDIMQNDRYLVNFLKRTCLYCDQIIINDPLHDVVCPVPIFDTLQRCRPKTEKQIKQNLTIAVSTIIKTKKLIEEGIVVLAPIGRYLQKVNASISELAMRDIQNPQFRNVCLNNIRSEIRTEKSYRLLEVTMGSSDGAWASSYGTSGNEDLEETKNRLTEALIFAAAYDINKTIHISSISNAKIVTGFDLYWNLINAKYGNSYSDLSVKSLLEMNLKYLDNVSFSEIVEFRRKNLSTFEDFRIRLGEIFNEINEITYDGDFHKKVNDIQKKQINPELRKLDREFSRIKNYRLLRGASIAVAGVVGSYLAGGFLPAIAGGTAIASGLGLIKEYADWMKEQDKLKENSMYFLWKIKQK